MTMGGYLVVKQGEGGVQYMYTEDLWGDRPTIGAHNCNLTGFRIAMCIYIYRDPDTRHRA